MDKEIGGCYGWSARLIQHGSDLSILRVEGKCKFSNAGYSVELQRKEPQGINPTMCILTRVVHAPTRPGRQEESVVEVKYSEPTGNDYESVLILPDGFEVQVSRS